MAIEALGTAMTLQAQSVPKAVEVPKVEAKETKEEFKDSSQVVVNDVKAPVVSVADGFGDSHQEGQSQQDLDAERVKEAVKQINKNLNSSEAVFGFHEDTNRVTIKIVDKDTKELIKEVPAEKTLDMISRVWEMAGILIDEKC